MVSHFVTTDTRENDALTSNSKAWGYGKPDRNTRNEINLAAVAVFSRTDINVPASKQVTLIVEELRSRHVLWKRCFLEEHENGSKSQIYKAIQNKVGGRKRQDRVRSERTQKKRSFDDWLSDHHE